MKYYLLKILPQDDSVVVSTLPHPISMFFIGVMLVITIVVLTDVKSFRKDNEKMKRIIQDLQNKLESCKLENEGKINEVSKKIDSRVDKALLSFKKNNKISE